MHEVQGLTQEAEHFHSDQGGQQKGKQDQDTAFAIAPKQQREDEEIGTDD